MKTKKLVRLLTVLAGVLTAVIIVVSQVFLYRAEAVSKAAPATEQNESGSPSEGQAYLSLPTSYSIPSSIHVVSNQDLAFIEELLLGDQQDETTPVAIQHAAGRLFKTLFHYIISPNAP